MLFPRARPFPPSVPRPSRIKKRKALEVSGERQGVSGKKTFPTHALPLTAHCLPVIASSHRSPLTTLMLRYINEAEVAQILPMPKTIDLVEAALRARPEGRAIDVPRVRARAPA